MGKFLFILFIFSSSHSWALDNCNVAGPEELFELIKKNHPRIALNNANLDSIKASEEIAKQRPNPEFDGQSTVGETLSSKIYTTSVSLKHTVELGGKRDARINFASKSIEYGNEVTRGSNEDILIDTVIKLHRLRQIHALIPIYEEALGTFKKIHSNFSKLKSLSPQQQVEKETLSLAINDYRLNVSELKAEKVNLTRHVSFFVGGGCEVSKNSLPTNVNVDYEIKNSSLDGYAKLAAAKKLLEAANAKYEIEKSLAIPNMQIGPTYQYNRQNLNNTHTVGIGVTMDIPFLNTNAGGKMQALKQVNSAKISLRNAQMEGEVDIKSWETKYSNYSSSLKGIASRNELEKKHHKIEALFERGIISTSLVIESHRQLISFYLTRFNFELGAVEALWNIYKIKGELNEQNI